MSAIDQWADVKPGDKVTVTVEVIVAKIERYDNAYVGTAPLRPFTSIAYAAGEPYERPAPYGGGLHSDIFTIEVPDYDSPNVTVEVSS